MEEEILDILDHSDDGFYSSFVELGYVYSYLIDSRLNVFWSDDDRWAIAIERVGYNPRLGCIHLDIYYYGNCLINREYCNERLTNVYSIHPVDEHSFNKTLNEESLSANSKFWMISRQKIGLSLDKSEYMDAGIELKEYEPDEIRIEEAARLLKVKHPNLFRATDAQLYKSIPSDLKKTLMLDEWYHKDFALQSVGGMTDAHLKYTYEFNRNLTGLQEIGFEEFERSIRHQEMLNDEYNSEMWNNNRPSTYETWQQIAKAIAQKDAQIYKPTLAPNTHWSNWPESGSL